MTNPVMERMAKNWSKEAPANTPSSGDSQGYPQQGYPQGQAYPQQGYQQAYPQQGYPQGQAYPQQGYQQAYPQQGYPSHNQTNGNGWNGHEFENSYRGFSADAVDRGVMTYDDVIVKTGILFAALVVSAGISWTLTVYSVALAAVFVFLGGIGGFALAMVNIFSKKIRPALIVSYAVAEGMLLGAVSCLMEMTEYSGIVIQAVLATLAVFLVTLALFASGKVRNTPKLGRITIIALISVLVYSCVMWILDVTGVVAGGESSIVVMGIPLGVIVGLVCVLIGAMCLVQDFDEAKQGVNAGVPAIFAWQCAFGLMVTIVWMYMEILRILSYLNDN